MQQDEKPGSETRQTSNKKPEDQSATNQPAPGKQGEATRDGPVGNRQSGQGAGQGQRAQQNQQPKKGNGQNAGPKKPAGPAVQIRPTAEPAHMKRRHWGLLLSFGLSVLLPLFIGAVYLWGISTDQYASTVGFTVRHEEDGTASELLGGLAKFATSSGGGSDTDILYEFIQSQDMVQKVNDRVDLASIYSTHWPGDPLFSIWPWASIEDLVWFWNRVVRVSYDQNSGMVELRVLAFDPQTAQEIAQAIVDESQKMINGLNDAARSDLMRYAEEDLAKAVNRLKKTRQALIDFRTRTQIVDPQNDLQGQSGVINNLQQQLAQALVEMDLLTETANANDPRVVQQRRRIEAIRQRISSERESLATDKLSGVGADYPTLMAEYEGLNVDRQYAEESYRAALSALDLARDKAARQTRYLATYIPPTKAQTSEYPQRWIIFGLTALFLTMLWGIGALVYYSIRDRH